MLSLSPLPPQHGRLQTAIQAYLRAHSPATFNAIWLALGRPHRGSLQNALARASKDGRIEHPRHDCYEAKQPEAVALGLVVRATLDELERSYGPALAAELALRGWTK